MKIFTKIILIISILFLGVPVLAEPESYEQGKLQNIRKELNESKKVLAETKAKERESLQKLVIVNKELKETEGSLSQAKNKLNYNKRNINRLSSELTVAQRNLKNKSEVLSKRVVDVYKGNRANSIELLLSAKSMSDFINNSYFFGKIIERDIELINDITKDYRNVKTKKNSLEQANKSIKQLAKEMDVKKKVIEIKADEKKQLYESLRSRRREYEKKIEELEQSSQEMQTLIERSVRERSRDFVSGTGKLIWPIYGRITSWFGYRRHPFYRRRQFHTGLDMAKAYGSPIKAADNGEVLFSGWWDGYGKAITIDHGNGISTVYGHLSRIYVQKGAKITQGQIIGLLGNTGYSTGPHLHFEVRKKGKPQNPIKWLPKI